MLEGSPICNTIPWGSPHTHMLGGSPICNTIPWGSLYTHMLGGSPFCNTIPWGHFIHSPNKLLIPLPDAQLRLHLSTPNKLLVNLFQMPSWGMTEQCLYSSLQHPYRHDKTRQNTTCRSGLIAYELCSSGCPQHTGCSQGVALTPWRPQLWSGKEHSAQHTRWSHGKVVDEWLHSIQPLSATLSVEVAGMTRDY